MHILHFVLTLLTGAWAIVWIILAFRIHAHNKKIDQQAQMLMASAAESGASRAS